MQVGNAKARTTGLEISSCPASSAKPHLPAYVGTGDTGTLGPDLSGIRETTGGRLRDTGAEPVGYTGDGWRETQRHRG